MSSLFRLVFVVLIALSSSASWGYAYDVVSNPSNYENIESELQKFGYDDVRNFHYCCSDFIKNGLHEKTQNGSFFAFIDFSNAAKGARNTVVRTTRAGDKAIRTTRLDGSVIDISPKRVKEFVPNTHPKAPSGALDRVKFDNAIPGSKGFKRLPTQQELDTLNKAK